jgi:hypothetical protein
MLRGRSGVTGEVLIILGNAMVSDVDKAIYPNEADELDVENLDKQIEIGIPDEEVFGEGEVDIEEMEDGSVLVGPTPPVLQEGEFYQNLAEELEDQELAKILNTCLGDVQGDKSSRKEWEQQYRDGLEFLGMRYEERTQPFAGASGVTHPLLAESVTQFQAQAYKELLPSNGPVRTQIIGAKTPDSEQQASRVKEYMNYQITQVMKEYDPETDQLLFYLPLSGSAFRKVYYDQNLGRAVSQFIPSEDLVVPYGTADLQSAIRITHMLEMPINDVRKLQQSGFYIDVELSEMRGGADYEANDIQEEIDRLQGEEPSYSSTGECRLYEIHTDLNLQGYEDVDAEGNETGIKLPYIITLSPRNNAILSIRRNWRPEDPLKQKIHYFVHYKFLPGLGFYGFGLTHMIGSLSRSATSILRQLIDAGTLANLPAGFKARGIRIRNDDAPLQPGEFRDMDAPGGSLRDAFVTLPFKEPSATLLNLLAILVDAGRRFASIADLQIGQGNQEAPVGTTVALLERGTQVMSAIHKRLHYAQKLEFNLLAKIFAEALPPMYPYLTANGDQTIKQADFDARVDIVPVSDPNIFSMSQRIALAQELMQMVQSNPEIHGPQGIQESYRRMYMAMNVENIDAILPPLPVPQPKDPATENSGLILQQPAQAFPQQDQDSHITSHLSLYNTAQAQMNPPVLSLIQAHIYQHVSFKAAQMVDMENQQNPQMMQMQQQAMQNPELQQQMMAQVATRVAQVIAELMAQLNVNFAPPNPEDPLVDLRREEIAVKSADVQRKAREFEEKQKYDMVDMQQRDEIARERLDVMEDIAEMRNETAQDRLDQQEEFKKMDIKKEKGK